MRALLRIATAVLVLTGCRPAPPPPEAPPPTGRAWIAHQRGTLSLLEPGRRSLTTLAGRLWQEPSEMPAVRDLVVTRDGQTALVPSSRQDVVWVVELYAGRIEETIAVEGQPEQIALSRDGRRAYVTTAKPELAVIDVASESLDDPIAIGSSAAGMGGTETIQVTPDGRSVCVLTRRADLVLVDTASEEVRRSLPLGGVPLGLAVTPDSRRAWVAGFPANAVTLIDLANGRVLDAIAVGERPLGLALTPDGRWLYVANSGGASISVIDTAAGTVATTIGVAPGPSALTATREGDYILVAHTDASALTVLDTSKRAAAYGMGSDIVSQWPTAIAVP